MNMEDKPLTESINKQYSKYGSLRMKEKESRIQLCNAEDPMKFLTRIDSSIQDAKAKVKKSIDNSQISEDLYESSLDIQQQPNDNYDSLDTIPMVKLERNKVTAILNSNSSSFASPYSSSTTSTLQPTTSGSLQTPEATTSSSSTIQLCDPRAPD